MIFDAGVPPYNANQKKAGTRIELSYFISYGDICIHRDKSDNFEHYHPSNFHAVFNAKYAYSLIFIFGYRLKAVALEWRFNRKKKHLLFAWMDVALAQRYLCSSKYQVKSGGRKNLCTGYCFIKP